MLMPEKKKSLFANSLNYVIQISSHLSLGFDNRIDFPFKGAGVQGSVRAPGQGLPEAASAGGAGGRSTAHSGWQARQQSRWR